MTKKNVVDTLSRITTMVHEVKSRPADELLAMRLHETVLHEAEAYRSLFFREEFGTNPLREEEAELRGTIEHLLPREELEDVLSGGSDESWRQSLDGDDESWRESL